MNGLINFVKEKKEIKKKLKKLREKKWLCLISEDLYIFPPKIYHKFNYILVSAIYGENTLWLSGILNLLGSRKSSIPTNLISLPDVGSYEEFDFSTETYPSIRDIFIRQEGRKKVLPMPLCIYYILESLKSPSTVTSTHGLRDLSESNFYNSLKLFSSLLKSGCCCDITKRGPVLDTIGVFSDSGYPGIFKSQQHPLPHYSA